jgi:DNA-directed RNA polymerase specialized sigma24 family protein
LEIEDAMQEVFLECFRGGGVLERADPGCEGGFRAFLFGVARNVALRVEKRLAKARARGDGNAVDLDDIESDETAQSAAFDRAWAEALVREASEVQRRQAEHAGPECRRRIELLDLRFGEGVPIRDIAKLWDEDPVLLHREYEKARREFLGALREVVAFHHQGLPGEIDRECERLQELLS